MEYKYDYFISYAHKDNESKDDQLGFVNEFVEKLLDSKEHESMFGEKISVFFDTSEIKNMTDWDIRIRSSLAHSRFFVVLLSPNYFKSRYCAKEFDWWMQHEMHCRLLGEATAPMKIVTVDEIDNRVPEKPTIPEDLQAEFPNWMKNLQKIQSDYHFDMHDLERAKIDETLKALRLAIEDIRYSNRKLPRKPQSIQVIRSTIKTSSDGVKIFVLCVKLLVHHVLLPSPQSTVWAGLAKRNLRSPTAMLSRGIMGWGLFLPIARMKTPLKK